MAMILHHQNFMLALREEMGWPSFRPANASQHRESDQHARGNPSSTQVGRKTLVL